MPTIIVLVILIGILSLSIKKIKKDKSKGIGWVGCSSNSCDSRKK